MENFCGSACEESAAVLEGGFFRSVLYHSGGKHQRGTFFPEQDLVLLVVVTVVLQEQHLFQWAF